MRRLSLLLPPIAAALACPAPARAQSDQAVLSAAQALALEERFRTEGRDADADALLEALARDPDRQIRAEANFRIARTRLARGDIEGAIDAYQAVLEIEPDAQPVRLALAQALALAGRTGSAARELRRAEAGGLPEDVQRLVDGFSDVLRRSRPYGLTVEVGLAPDTNINQATGSNTIEIGGFPLTLNESGQAASGVGLTGSFDAFVTLPMGPGTSLVSRVAGAGNFYRRSAFDDLLVSASSGPEFTVGRVVARVAGTYAYRLIGSQRYSAGFGGSLQVSAPAGQGRQVGLTLAFSDLHYRIPEQSGLQYTAMASYEEALSSRLYGRIDASFARAEAGSEAYATTSFGGSVALSRDLGAATVYGRAGYARTDGDGPFALFGAGRADDRYDLSLGATWKRWSIAGLSPTLRVIRTRNESPLDLYRFKRTRFELTLSERF